VFNATFSYIMVTSFSGGGSRREPLTLGKQLVNFITCGCELSINMLENGMSRVLLLANRKTVK
jgi:hypothetical protein